MKLFFAVLLSFFILLLSGCSELSKSEETIKAEILSHVPFDSDISEVVEYLKFQKYEIDFVDKHDGFLDQRVRPAKITGKMSISANFGDYRGFIFMVNVTVYFAFDENGKLIDIWVWKTMDAP